MYGCVHHWGPQFFCKLTLTSSGTAGLNVEFFLLPIAYLPFPVYDWSFLRIFHEKLHNNNIWNYHFCCDRVTDGVALFDPRVGLEGGHKMESIMYIFISGTSAIRLLEVPTSNNPLSYWEANIKISFLLPNQSFYQLKEEPLKYFFVELQMGPTVGKVLTRWHDTSR